MYSIYGYVCICFYHIFSLCYVWDSVCVVCRIQFGFCAGFSQCCVQASVCVMCVIESVLCLVSMCSCACRSLRSRMLASLAWLASLSMWFKHTSVHLIPLFSRTLYEIQYTSLISAPERIGRDLDKPHLYIYICIYVYVYYIYIY